MTGMEPPEWYYLGVGKIIAATALLDYNFGRLVAIFRDDDDAALNSRMARPGAVATAVRDCLDKLPPSRCRDELDRAWTDASRLRNERHRLSHAVLVLDMPSAPGESHRWLLSSAKSRDDLLPTEAELAEVATRTKALATRLLGVQHLAADHVRTQGVIN